jgi:homoserine kinase type II
MAVYTDVTDADLTAFLGHYDIGKARALKGIAEGVENSNFLLHAGAGVYILTLYEKRVDEESLPFFLGLMEHLARHGLNCPLPVRNRSGGALGRIAGRPAAIVTFLEGVSATNPNSDQCAALGESLGKLHEAGADFPMRRPNSLGLSAWPELFQQVGARADEVQPGLSDLIAKELTFLERNWPDDLPSGIIHADLFPDNVLFLGDAVSGLIDFYFACVDDLAYDAAVCLNAWCFDKDQAFDGRKAQAFFTAYERVRPLTAAEAGAIPILARGAALRFTLTRLVDWLNVPPGALVHPKDPREYVRKLQVLQTIGGGAELGLIR